MKRKFPFKPVVRGKVVEYEPNKQRDISLLLENRKKEKRIEERNKTRALEALSQAVRNLEQTK